jgi:transcriptional regulator
MNLLQGTLDLLVLKALVFGPRHGYEVARWVRDTTQGTLEVDDGALYTALHRLEKRALVQAEWGIADTNRRAKFYSLTRAGRNEMAKETQAWTSYVDAVFKVLQAAETS